jgi:hypothetical protein
MHTVILPVLKLEAFWFKLHYQQPRKYGKLCLNNEQLHISHNQQPEHYTGSPYNGL